MNETILGNQLRKVPSIAVGCMRLSEKSKEEMNHFIHSALEQGAYFFDHADIYGGGMSETVFGDAFSHDPSLKREDVFLQSKCGIRQGCYDLSKEYILEAVDGILKRLRTDYLDLLLLHRPDATGCQSGTVQHSGFQPSCKWDGSQYGNTGFYRPRRKSA